MTRAVDRELLAERSASVVAHLERVAAALPADPEALTPMSSAVNGHVDLRAYGHRGSGWADT